jgi:hypothetical protein
MVKTDLNGASLCNAILKKTNLYYSNLIGADLSDAHFENTFCVASNFMRANLNHSTFIDAMLRESILTNSEINETKMINSTFGWTTFGNVDLSHVYGLDTANHDFPSFVDLHTIQKSGNIIPINFLRGCGIRENFIRYINSLKINPIEYYSCFISYNHQDKSFAKRLHDQLQAKGIRCWLDERQILPGEDIYEQVDRGIRKWDKVLLCCSQHSLTSWWVDNEVATAFSKEQQLMKDRGKKVLSLIPLNLDGYMFSDEWASGKRQQITDRLAADFTGWETDNAKFEEQFERVVKALQTEESREEAPVSRL